MWVLLLFVITVGSNGPTTLVTPLKREGVQPLYETQQACQTESDRIMLAMQQAYPNDTDFWLECKPVSRKAV